MSNYELIKRLDLESLAEFLADVSKRGVCSFCTSDNTSCCGDTCLDGIVDWLESEADDGSDRSKVISTINRAGKLHYSCPYCGGYLGNESKVFAENRCNYCGNEIHW